jgi:RNA polymerase sigma-70 factor (ECF subfamily)
MGSDLRSDDELLASIQRREMRALETLYDRHRIVAYSLALRMLGSPADAEEVVQESFLNVWRAAETYRSGRGAVRSWLLSIVHHRAIDRLRGRQSRPVPVVLEEGMDLPDRADVWEEVADRLTGQEVRAALQQLPAEQREAIELAYFKGYTQTQIAHIMTVPVGTVKGRMRLGLHKLRSLLEGSQTEMAIE